MGMKSKKSEEKEKIGKTIEKLKREGELKLKWEKPKTEFLREEERAFTPEEKEKKKRTEKQPLITLKQVQKRPWKALNITRKQWNGLKEPTKKQLWKELHERLTEQLQRTVKRRLNKSLDKLEMEDVERTMKEVVGEEVSRGTVLRIAQDLGIKEAGSELWNRGKEKYIETALEKEAMEPKEIKKAINEEGGNINMETAKDISRKVKKFEEFSKYEEVEEATEALKKEGATKQELEQKPTVDRDVLLEAAEKYAKRLKDNLGEEKTRKILKEKRGFTEEDVNEIMR